MSNESSVATVGSDDVDPIGIYEYIRSLFLTPEKMKEHAADTLYPTVELEYLNIISNNDDKNESTTTTKVKVQLGELLERCCTEIDDRNTAPNPSKGATAETKITTMKEFWSLLIKNQYRKVRYYGGALEETTPPSSETIFTLRQTLLDYCEQKLAIDDSLAIGILLRSSSYPLKQVDELQQDNIESLLYGFDRVLYLAAKDLPKPYELSLQSVLLSRFDKLVRDEQVTTIHATTVSADNLFAVPEIDESEQTKFLLCLDTTCLLERDRLFVKLSGEEDEPQQNIYGYYKTSLVLIKKTNHNKETKHKEQQSVKTLKTQQRDTNRNRPDPILWFQRIQEMAKIPIILQSREPWHIDVSSKKGAQLRQALEQLSALFCCGGSQYVPDDFWQVKRWMPLFAQNDSTRIEEQLNNQQLPIEELLQIAQPAPFGRDEETVVDPSVRNALDITADQIPTTLFSHARPLIDTKIVEQSMKPSNKSWKYQLYKMHIYGQGGKFLPHVDTIHGKNHVATLVVSLPSPHEGGVLVIHQGDKSRKLDFSKNSHWLRFGAFFTDCTHEIQPVTSGYRVVLQYDIFEEDDDSACNNKLDCSQVYGHCPQVYGSDVYGPAALASKAPHPALATATQAQLNHLITALDNLLIDKPSEAVGFLLRHKYPLLALASNVLRGTDRLMYDAIQASDLVSKDGATVSLYGLLLIAHDPQLGRDDFSSGSELYAKAIVVEDILEATSKQSDAKENAAPRKVLLVPDTKATFSGDYLIQQDRHYTGNETEPFYYAYYKACLVIIPKGYRDKIE